MSKWSMSVIGEVSGGWFDLQERPGGRWCRYLSLMGAVRKLLLSDPIEAREMFRQSVCVHTAMESIKIVRNRINHLARFFI